MIGHMRLLVSKKRLKLHLRYGFYDRKEVENLNCRLDTVFTEDYQAQGTVASGWCQLLFVRSHDSKYLQHFVGLKNVLRRTSLMDLIVFFIISQKRLRSQGWKGVVVLIKILCQTLKLLRSSSVVMKIRLVGLNFPRYTNLNKCFLRMLTYFLIFLRIKDKDGNVYC